MSRVFQITLMWLIALAVPLQGFAAAAMPGCDPSHHAMAAPVPVVEPHGDAMMAMPHAQTMAADASDAGPSADAHAHARWTESHGASHASAKGSCTPCAFCCVGAALPAAVLTLEPVPPTDFFVLSDPDSAVAFLTEGLERPPRSFLV